jgi:hypothetical protein
VLLVWTFATTEPAAAAETNLLTALGPDLHRARPAVSRVGLPPDPRRAPP